MGCVCDSNFLPPVESNFDCSYITIRFEDSENGKNFASTRTFSTKKQSNNKIIPENPVQETYESTTSMKSFDHPPPKKVWKKKPKIHNDYIICGSLMKYHPGISAQFIRR